jgi:hypothetical protein
MPSDVPFESEQALRERGTSRTPDVLLSCPMGVRVTKKDADDDGWRVICWIDSKVSTIFCSALSLMSIVDCTESRQCTVGSLW